MSANRSGGDKKNDSPEPVTQAQMKQDEDDLNRGKFLLRVFIFLLVFFGGIYIYAHYKKPAGLFSPTATALKTVSDANTALTAVKQDVLEPDVINNLTSLSDRLGLLAPPLGTGTDYGAILAQINIELGGKEVHRKVLSPLFVQIGNIIQVGSGSYFWSGSTDRWVELVFWAIVGTVVFLLSEIKKYYSMPYQNGKRNFIKYTPWYAVNFFRGTFIALVILLALTSISFDAIGISIDIKSAPIEVLIILVAILGYYSRVADKQLDIIAEKLLPYAWKKAYPDAQGNASQPAADEQPAVPTADEQPAAPAADEQPASPAVADQPAAPTADEQPAAPAVVEQPVTT